MGPVFVRNGEPEEGVVTKSRTGGRYEQKQDEKLYGLYKDGDPETYAVGPGLSVQVNTTRVGV